MSPMEGSTVVARLKCVGTRLHHTAVTVTYTKKYNLGSYSMVWSGHHIYGSKSKDQPCKVQGKLNFPVPVRTV